ncbi:MAG: SDR family NAD(P)-dependent oxidoreductase [Acidimicrobiales bacterium]|nr:SDR family NAD(P)-dependent oxidoreductase [Acidimicrobiales bacterium]
MGDRLRGRAAVVTGAGNGIGKAIALALGAEGAAVVVNDLGTNEFGDGSSSAAADQTVAEIEAAGGTAVSNADSVAESAGCERAVQTAVEAFGSCDIVVGCAGAILGGSLDADDDTWRRLVDLFLSQKFWLARAAVPAMLDRGWGRVVFTTSEVSRGTQGMPGGAAVFGGTISLAKALAHEHRGSGVTFNCFAPGASTRLHAVARPHYEAGLENGMFTQDDWDRYVNIPPAEYVAPIVAWLCTDAASGVSGEVFHAAGGTVGRWSHYEDRGSVFRGDHRTNPPWSLDELDEFVPQHLLP